MSRLKSPRLSEVEQDRGLLRPFHTQVITSYPVSVTRSTSQRDETELSWETFSDHQWPSDAWVVGADVDPDEWPAGTFGEEGAV